MSHVIAIDGPAGAGKSTVARRVAQRLGWRFLDTGALYRAVALAALRQGIPAEDATRVADVARRAQLSQDAQGRTLLDGHDVSAEIRTAAVTAFASRVSAVPEVRQALLDLQRRAASTEDLVCEGRDMGTVVFPQATLKVFLDARSEVRSERRALELESRDGSVDRAAVHRDLNARDTADTARSVAPLCQAADAVVLDTSALDVAAVTDRILSLYADRVGTGTTRG